MALALVAQRRLLAVLPDRERLATVVLHPLRVERLIQRMARAALRASLVVPALVPAQVARLL